MESCDRIEVVAFLSAVIQKRRGESRAEKGVFMEEKKKFIVNMAFYGIIVILILLLCQYVLPIMTPFIIAFCVAAIINALTKRMKIRPEKLRRLLAVVFCALIYGVALLAVVLVGSKLVRVVIDLVSGIPSLFAEVILPWLQSNADQLETAVTPYDTMLATTIDSITGSMLKSISQFVTEFSTKAMMWVTSSATSIPNLIVDLVIMVISTFFMALDFDMVWGFLKKLIPAKQHSLLNTGAHYTKTMILVYIKSYSLLFVLTFVELTIGFLILRIPNAFILAFAIAVFDLMPVLGTGGVLLPWALVMLIMDDYVMAVGLLVLYLVITGIRNTLEPKIVGKQIGLHPLATLAAMILGLRLFGLVGLFVFPIALTVANAMHRSQEASKTETSASA